PHGNNIQLGKDGRYRTNVWEYAGVNTFGKDRDEQLAMHPTVKPIQMVADAILDVTKPDDLIFDGFLGSGTTLLAAEQVDRRCYATEIDPRYVDVALRRWINLTGEQPILQQTTESYEQRATLKEAS
ncbi:MAG: DNA-methyltransferase, partial [Pseudohongiellaceae bacterium]